MDEKWVFLMYAKNQVEASIIKEKLEAEGIPVFIKQEAIGKIYYLTVNGLGEIKILVPSSMKEKAKKILMEHIKKL